MDKSTFELLAFVGEITIYQSLMEHGALRGIESVPTLFMSVFTVGGSAQVIVDIEDKPRRLVLDPDFGWMWYNSEGPEE